MTIHPLAQLEGGLEKLGRKTDDGVSPEVQSVSRDVNALRVLSRFAERTDRRGDSREVEHDDLG